jgi:hypothetical protein
VDAHVPLFLRFGGEVRHVIRAQVYGLGEARVLRVRAQARDRRGGQKPPNFRLRLVGDRESNPDVPLSRVGVWWLLLIPRSDAPPAYAL